MVAHFPDVRLDDDLHKLAGLIVTHGRLFTLLGENAKAPPVFLRAGLFVWGSYLALEIC